MAAPVNPSVADPHYTTLLNQLFPVEKRGKDPALRTFELILARDTARLKEWIVTDTVQRVNQVATKMLLHPLHVCAMTGSIECAALLIESGSCQINPQDASRATPLHHAAVRNHQAMISFFLKNKAEALPDRFGGTYVNVLRQIQEPKPEAQIFYYKNEAGEIVQGNGNDFQRLTGARFLDRDCRITPQEWLKLWQKEADAPGLVPRSLAKRYEEFCKNPPKIYVEKHPKVGLNVCAEQDFEPGMVIGEYFGDVREGACNLPAGSYTQEQVKRLQKEKEYIYDNMDATHFRGIVPLCNDSFPNAKCYDLFQTKGMPVRRVLVAIQPIKKGEPIVFSYGLGHTIRMEKRCELRQEAFNHYFKNECARGFASFVNKGLDINDSALANGHSPEPDKVMPCQAFLYIFSTPAAMLRLLIEKSIRIDEFKLLFSQPELLHALKMWLNGYDTPYNWAELENFYETVFQFFDKLDQFSPKKRQEQLAQLKFALDKSDIEALILLMGGNPHAYIETVTQSQLREMFRSKKAPADEKSRT